MPETMPMPSGALMSAMVRKVDVGVAQAKLTVPVKGSGVKIPLSITYATRTEFVDEKIVRANFGVTLDLDDLFASAWK